ncbi:DUF4328 domain-containing protein [Chitiniphilus shinanonensis]|uniref:DUF4328 domain-containing protein n=1 Tax=Chitiniphilus shinanonensis TaxID=553088 RepID=UPI00333E2895
MMAHLGTKKAGAARVAGGGFGNRKNKQVQGNGMTGWWWGLWIASNVAGNVALRVVMHAEEIDGYMWANIATQISDWIGIPSSIATLLVVQRIYAMQMASLRRNAEAVDLS